MSGSGDFERLDGIFHLHLHHLCDVLRLNFTLKKIACQSEVVSMGGSDSSHDRGDRIMTRKSIWASHHVCSSIRTGGTSRDVDVDIQKFG